MVWIVLGMALVAVMVLAVAYVLLSIQPLIWEARQDLQGLLLNSDILVNSKREEVDLIRTRNTMIRDVETLTAKRHAERMESLGVAVEMALSQDEKDLAKLDDGDYR